FDIVPALLMAVSLACLGRDRLVVSAVFLGAATMVKVYPGLAALLVVRYLSGDWRRMAVWATTYGLTLLSIFTATVGTTGWEATVAPYRVQLARTLEPLTFYGHVLPTALGDDNTAAKGFRLSAVLTTLLVLASRRPADLAGLLRRSAIVLIVFVSLQVFYSPQWVLWLAPLLVPLARLHRPVLWLVIALDVVTYLTFPVVFDMIHYPYQHVLM